MAPTLAPATARDTPGNRSHRTTAQGVEVGAQLAAHGASVARRARVANGAAGTRTYPRAHWQVSFMELALDFEAFAGRPLPPTPELKYVGGDLSLQEKGRVVRLIVTLVGRAT